MEIFFLNAFQDREEFNEYRKRFGTDATQFFFLNDCAVAACKHFDIPITPVGIVDELPQNAGVALKHLYATGATAPARAGDTPHDCDGNGSTGPMAAKPGN